MQRRLRTTGSIVRSPSLLAASVSQHTARERSILCVAAIDAELEVCCESGAKLRTNHGPTTDHDGRTQRTSTINHRHQRTVVHARQPCSPIWGQGIASSNLASPTSQCRIITPDQSRVHPATGPSSTSLSAGELGPDWAHQREYAAPTSSTAGLIRVKITARHRRVLIASHTRWRR